MYRKFFAITALLVSASTCRALPGLDSSIAVLRHGRDFAYAAQPSQNHFHVAGRFVAGYATPYLFKNFKQSLNEVKNAGSQPELAASAKKLLVNGIVASAAVVYGVANSHVYAAGLAFNLFEKFVGSRA